ncbi:MAG: YggT family protein [Acidimicrobiales bacterium]
MASTLVLILQIVSLVFVARAIVSWFPIRPNSPIYPAVDLLYRITEPVLAPIRRLLPPTSGVDFSTLLVILGINFVLVPLVSRL